MDAADPLEIMEKIGSYAAGELMSAEAAEVERLLLENEEDQRLAESYVRMFVLLSAFGEEFSEAPEAVVNYAVRQAYMSALLRQVDEIARGLVRDYLGALISYLGLRPARQ